MARCINFDAGVWNAGPTCITNLAHKDKHAQCSDRVKKAVKANIKKLCKPATKDDNDACQTFRESLAEYY